MPRGHNQNILIITILITRFYIKFPGQEINWLTFLLPFADELWLGLLVLFFTLFVFLAAFYKFGPERKLNPKSFVPGSTLIVVWGSWIAQGSWLDPKSIASRIVFLVSFVCGVLIYTAYSAKLISYLSVGCACANSMSKTWLSASFGTTFVGQRGHQSTVGPQVGG